MRAWLARCATRYTTSIALSPTGERDEKLLCNRSLAFLKAGRHALAAEDAQRACALAPEWNKAWYRAGAAQAALQQYPAALEAYTRCLRLDASKRDVLPAVRSTVKRLTREQLAARLLSWLDEMQASGALLPPEAEDVTQAEREEAMFRHLQLWMRDKPQPGDYYDYVTLWCETEWSPGARRAFLQTPRESDSEHDRHGVHSPRCHVLSCQVLSAGGSRCEGSHRLLPLQ